MKRILVLALPLCLAACGSDDDNSQSGTVSEAQAATTVEGMADLFAAVNANNGSDALSAIGTLSGAGLTLVVPEGQQAPATEPAPQALLGQTGCECTGGSCAFTACGGILDGTLSVSGNTVSVDITYDFSGFSFAISGSVTVTETMIDGMLSSMGTVTGDMGGSATWNWSVTWNAVTIDGMGCPTGGSVSASVSVSGMSSGGQSGDYNVSGDATFTGATCN